MAPRYDFAIFPLRPPSGAWLLASYFSFSNFGRRRRRYALRAELICGFFTEPWMIVRESWRKLQICNQSPWKPVLFATAVFFSWPRSVAVAVQFSLVQFSAVLFDGDLQFFIHIFQNVSIKKV